MPEDIYTADCKTVKPIVSDTAKKLGPSWREEQPTKHGQSNNLFILYNTDPVQGLESILTYCVQGRGTPPVRLLQ